MQSFFCRPDAEEPGSGGLGGDAKGAGSLDVGPLAGCGFFEGRARRSVARPRPFSVDDSSAAEGSGSSSRGGGRGAAGRRRRGAPTGQAVFFVSSPRWASESSRGAESAGPAGGRGVVSEGSVAGSGWKVSESFREKVGRPAIGGSGRRRVATVHSLVSRAGSLGRDLEQPKEPSALPGSSPIASSGLSMLIPLEPAPSIGQAFWGEKANDAALPFPDPSVDVDAGGVRGSDKARWSPSAEAASERGETLSSSIDRVFLCSLST